MQQILLIILVIIAIYHTYNLLARNRPVYVNVHLGDICRKLDNDSKEETEEHPELRDRAEKILEEKDEDGNVCFRKTKSCSDELFELQQKYKELMLKYNDPEPNSIDYLYKNLSKDKITDDDAITYKMLDMTHKPKEAIMNRAMWTKNSFLPYIEEELRAHENSIWYENQDLEYLM